ncbi:MAG: T9SS type B sorting domain-containing protein, partial [Myroides sp.]
LEYKLDEGSWQDSNIFLDVTPGEHTVYVRIEGEPCIASKVITVMDYPKFFTPNNDGYNDTWNIWSLKNQPDTKIYIFDRFGKLIKQLSPAGAGWDGTFNGQPLPSTDYWFKAEYIDPKTGLNKEVTGHFSLKR